MARLRMSDDALDELRGGVSPLDTDEVRSLYRARLFPRADLVKDVDRRYRWDLLSAAFGCGFACARYDEGLTNDHIDSALRAVVAPL